MTFLELTGIARQWFVELLRIDTTNPPGNETRAVQFIARALASYGIESSLLGEDPARLNLVARIEPSGSVSASPLLLSSHVDVVPAQSPHLWKHPPFGGVEEGGEIYGRGAVDMKYKTAFDMAVLVWFKKQGISCPLILTAVADEECGCEGVKYLISKHRELIAAEYVLNEVGGFTVSCGDGLFAPIQLGEKGSGSLTIETTGPSGHASAPIPNNSISLLAKLVSGLSEWRHYRCTRLARAFIEGVRDGQRSEETRALFAALLSPDHCRAALDLIPDPFLAAQLRGIVSNTVTPTMLTGSAKSNVIPPTASALCDLRILPGDDEHQIVANIEEFLRGVAEESEADRFSLRLSHFSAGYELSPGERGYLQLADVVSRHWSPSVVGAPPLMTFASSDNTYYAHAGFKPIGFAPLRFPQGYPGFSLAHGVDERIPTAAFDQGLMLYKEGILALCSGAH